MKIRREDEEDDSGCDDDGEDDIYDNSAIEKAEGEPKLATAAISNIPFLTNEPCG